MHAQDPQVHSRGLRPLQLRDHGVREARRGVRARVPARRRRYASSIKTVQDLFIDFYCILSTYETFLFQSTRTSSPASLKARAQSNTRGSSLRSLSRPRTPMWRGSSVGRRSTPTISGSRWSSRTPCESWLSRTPCWGTRARSRPRPTSTARVEN